MTHSKKHELKAHTNLLQQISKAKLLGEDNGHKSRVLGDANTTICKFKINQAELEHAERLGDPSVALFLEHHLGSMKWHIFTEKRVDKGKPSEQQRSSIIDFLVKTEIIKEVFRKFLPCVQNHFPVRFLLTLAYIQACVQRGQLCRSYLVQVAQR